MEGYGNENPGAFQPTRPLRGATEIAHKLTDTIKFQPTRPLRGATRPASSGSACRSNFNPRAPCGARPVWIRIEIAIHDFNPRAPCGARRTPRATSLTRTTNFNPRAPCGARPRARFPLSIFLLISTHAPLAGRDRWIGNKKNKRINFNPRAPCGARQGMQYPLRGANYISTHAPLAGRDPRRQTGVRQAQEISTHAPLAGRDGRCWECSCPARFQPTRPLRGATRARGMARKGDGNFNPRAPCGARQQKCTNHYAHFCDNRQISDAFAQNAACQGILLLFDAGKSCGFWVRTAQVISAHLCFAL